MAEKRHPSDEAAMLRLRVSHELRDELKAAAKANNRTMNAEVVHRLSSFNFYVHAYEVSVQRIELIDRELEELKQKYANVYVKYLKVMDGIALSDAFEEKLSRFVAEIVFSDDVRQATIEAYKSRIREFAAHTYGGVAGGEFDDKVDKHLLPLVVEAEMRAQGNDAAADDWLNARLEMERQEKKEED